MELVRPPLLKLVFNVLERVADLWELVLSCVYLPSSSSAPSVRSLMYVSLQLGATSFICVHEVLGELSTPKSQNRDGC